MKNSNKEIEKIIKPFKELEYDPREREELLDDFILALNTSDLDSDKAIRYMRKRTIYSLLFVLLGIILIVLAGLIILYPLPKYLEVRTLFYFNPNDGITVSDLVGGLILLAGIIITVHGTALRKTY